MNACSRRGITALGHDELRELALLYRQAAADLSVAREDRASAHRAQYLNQLLGRAHNLIYSAGRPKPAGLVDFYLRQFPAAFRDTLPYTLAAFALFVAGAVAGVLLAAADPGFERFVLGGRMMDTIERREMWTHAILSIKPAASSAIMTNNLAVAIAACATGMLAGLGTVYMMLMNGVLIGVIGTACYRAGMSLSLWSFVVPHGVLELPAIFIAGGAGLLLARGILVPGTLPRRDSMSDAGAQAIRLFLGVIPLLVIAGIIEAFVSPTGLDVTTKFVTGGSLAVLLAWYLSSARRARR